MSSQKKTASRRPYRANPASNPSTTASKQPLTSISWGNLGENSEPNDEELEQSLASLNRVFSVSLGDPKPNAKSPYETELIGSNFSELIRTCAGKLVNQGNLSSTRHQFALLLIALHRRDEQVKSQMTTTENAFNVEWSQDTVLLVINLLLSTVSSSFSPNSYVVFLDSLRALSLVLFGNYSHYASEYARILAILKPLCDVRMVVDKEVQRVAFNCIGNMFYKCGILVQSHYQDVWNLWMRQIAHLQPQVLAQVGLSRSFAALLRGIQFLITEAHGIHEPGLPSLVSMLCKFIFYGTPLGVMPSLEKPDRNGTGSNDDDETASNGSEYSGSDVYNDKNGTWKVRYHALGCLQAVARSSAEKFKAFWVHLLPQSRLQPSIIAIISSDPVHQVRSAACRLVSTLFDGQQSFLHASLPKRALDPSHIPFSHENQAYHSAQGILDPQLGTPEPTTPSKEKSTSSHRHDARRTPISPKSFTPISMQLSNMLQEAHIGLLNAVTVETRQTTLIAIVKTIAVLAHESPYDALPSGLLTKLILPIQKFALDRTYSDHRLLRASISALSAFIGAQTTYNEVNDVLDASHETLIAYFKGLLVDDTSLSVKTEIFRFFSALALNRPIDIIPHWDVVFKVVMDTIVGEKAREIDPNARYAAAKVIDDLSKSLHRTIDSSSLDPKNEILEKFTMDLWQSILNSRITELMVIDRFGLVRSSICNLFSQVPSPIFASLSRKYQVVCITLLLGAIKDEVPAVRAQAARALGVYILNPSLKVDPLFVSDVTLALVSSMKDKNLNVRTKVAWSAANLCDALVTLRETTRSTSLHPPSSHIPNDLDHSTLEIGALDDIPRESLTALARGLLSQCKDNDKVRCNTVRAVGNFIRFADAALLEQPVLDMNQESTKKSATSLKRSGPSTPSNPPSSPVLITQIVDTLCQLTHEGSAKVRWNACYALANLFHNPLIIASSHTDWLESSISALIVALTQSTNFKVRINATIALHFATLSGALSIVSACSASILDAIISNLHPIDPQEELNESGYDEKYQTSLQYHLHQLASSCIYCISTLPITERLMDIIRPHFALLKRLTDDFENFPQPLASEHPGDQDESTSRSHTQLMLPTFQELKNHAKAASFWLAQLHISPDQSALHDS